ncbi:MAG: hypothetical protein HOY78_24935 [Saccharothrix sp.]|nr:hypothetical protein [Saccharothrix sp.]
MPVVDGEAACELCGDTGTMRWQQPMPTIDGRYALVEMTHPCTCPPGNWSRHPAAEQSLVVDPATDESEQGNVAKANLPHRTDWSRPRTTSTHKNPSSAPATAHPTRTG